jgi:hypothetical protein
VHKRGIIAGSIGVTLLAAAALRGVLRRFEIREASMAPALGSPSLPTPIRMDGQFGRWADKSLKTAFCWNRKN